MSRILLLNGPNLNRLGTREPERYGRKTLAQIEAKLVAQAKRAGHDLDCFQSNAEAELIDAIEATEDAGTEFIIFNPAAFTHTSIALRDALLARGLPFVEIHLSNIHSRETFRRHSYFSDIAAGCISGFGSLGYALALDAAAAHLQSGDDENDTGTH